MQRCGRDPFLRGKKRACKHYHQRHAYIRESARLALIPLIVSISMYRWTKPKSNDAIRVRECGIVRLKERGSEVSIGDGQHPSKNVANTICARISSFRVGSMSRNPWVLMVCRYSICFGWRMHLLAKERFSPIRSLVLEKLCSRPIERKRGGAYQIQNTVAELESIVPYYRDELKPSMHLVGLAGKNCISMLMERPSCDTKLI